MFLTLQYVYLFRLLHSLEGKENDKEDEEHRLKMLRGGSNWSSFLQMYELHGRERN